MDFQLSEEQAELRESGRRYATERLNETAQIALMNIEEN
jgi:hypothetical protein